MFFDPDNIRGFIQDDLAGAFNRADGKALLAMLHPVLKDVFGEDLCAEFTDGLSSPDLEIEVQGFSAFGTWAILLDGGVRIPFEDIHTVDVIRREGGTEILQQTHIGQIDLELFWFADCLNLP